LHVLRNLRDIMPNVVTTEQVRIETGGVVMDGDLHLPEHPMGLVIFAHGSGSSRFSSRNRAVARVLEEAGFGALLLDLLTRDEEVTDASTAEHRFNIDLLGERVIAAVDWVQWRDDLSQLPVALFGASTGAAAALIAAAARPTVAAAVISRGGRPDLAPEALRNVQAPTLLIVGGDDTPVIEMNRDAMRHMRSPVTLEIVPGASHLFDEPGALERVARLAADWCRHHLVF
jgi:putative phosphoribosyl transferase